MKSIISRMGTDMYPRVRVGIGEKPPRLDLVEYVLGHFTKTELEIIDDAVRDAASAVEMLIRDGAQAAMNRYNKVKKPAETSGGTKEAAETDGAKKPAAPAANQNEGTP